MAHPAGHQRWTAGIGAGLVVMNGNVGIGTWVPAAVLDIKGSMRNYPIVLTDAATVATNAALGNLASKPAGSAGKRIRSLDRPPHIAIGRGGSGRMGSGAGERQDVGWGV